MFNFETVKNITNKQIQLTDVKVFANNKIRLGEAVREKLGLSTKNVLIVRDGSGNFAIAGVAADGGEGRPINEAGEFSHQTIANLLGGQRSEWALKGEPMLHPVTKDVYYSLVCEVNGETERANMITSGVESSEIITEDDDEETHTITELDSDEDLEVAWPDEDDDEDSEIAGH